MTNIALGVMARPPVAGRCKTRLLGAMCAEDAADLVAAMTRDTVTSAAAAAFDHGVVFAAPIDAGDVLAEAGCRRLRALAPPGWHVVPQVAGDLGARMEAALDTLFEAGATRAALIGTDAPTAPIEDLRRGLEQLDGGVVVGPADDGGYWTIGMTRVERALLRDMPWSTPELFAATRVRCEEIGLPLVPLDRAFDVDEPADVQRLADALVDSPALAPHTAAWLTRTWRPRAGAADAPAALTARGGGIIARG